MNKTERQGRENQFVPFKYVSLFSGIGGFEQALNSLGGTCVMASEIDKFAEKSYQAIYGHSTVGDVTEIDERDVPNHDMLVGGFPCQAFSVAGNREGFDDTRGTLFFEIARIAKEKKPKLLLLENVKGLVGHDKGKTLDKIVEVLNEIGYVVDYEVLNSKFFGVPQNRERIFILAVREDLIEQEEWIFEGNTVVPKSKRRIAAYEGVKTFNFNWPAQEEVTVRLREILEPVVEDRFYLSSEKTETLIKQLEEQQFQGETKIIQQNQSKKLFVKNETGTVTTSMGSSQASKVLEPKTVGHVDINGHDLLKRVYDPATVSPTLTSMGGGNTEPKIVIKGEFPDLPMDKWRKIKLKRKKYKEEPKLDIVGHSGSGGQKGYIYNEEGLMSTLTATDYKQPKQIVTKTQESLNAGTTDGMTNIREDEMVSTLTASYYKGLCGQSRPHVLEKEEVRPVLTPDRITKRQNGRRMKENDEDSFTLTSQDKHGVAHGVFPKYQIRKLTPRECFRLQGFGDDIFEILVEAGISNTQLYKQAGNAVTVNVIQAIGEKIREFGLLNEDKTIYKKVTFKEKKEETKVEENTARPRSLWG